MTAAQFGLLAQPAQLTRKIAAVHVHHTWRDRQLTPTGSRAAWCPLACAVRDQIVAQSEEDNGVPRLRSLRAPVDRRSQAGNRRVSDGAGRRGCGTAAR